jgi:diaminopimelate decarboxylase
MADKTLPFSRQKLEEILSTYPTPFHLYDEKGIRENARRLKKAFSWVPAFRE